MKTTTGKLRTLPTATRTQRPRRTPVGSSTPTTGFNAPALKLKKKKSSQSRDEVEDSVCRAAVAQAPSLVLRVADKSTVISATQITTAGDEEAVGEEEGSGRATDLAKRKCSVETNNNSNSSLMQDKSGKELLKETPSQVPRSRLSTFSRTPTRSVANPKRMPFTDGLRKDPSREFLSTSSTSTSSPAAASRESTSRIDSSIVKNGSVISTLVTYANSISDTVHEAVTSQQDSVTFKLEEITVSLSVLPNLTQIIGDLVSKVDSLEAMLVERTNQLNAIEIECNLYRDQMYTRTNQLTESIDKLSVSVKQCETLSEQSNKQADSINAMLSVLEKSISIVTETLNKQSNIPFIDSA